MYRLYRSPEAQNCPYSPLSNFAVVWAWGIIHGYADTSGASESYVDEAWVLVWVFLLTNWGFSRTFNLLTYDWTQPVRFGMKLTNSLLTSTDLGTSIAYGFVKTDEWHAVSCHPIRDLAHRKRKRAEKGWVGIKPASKWFEFLDLSNTPSALHLKGLGGGHFVRL